MRRFFVLTLGLMLATTACVEETPTGIQPQFAKSPNATGQAGQATYRVTVSNLTGGQPFTPPLAAVHRASLSLFEVGSPASSEVQQIAENGNLDPMVDLVGGHQHVADFGVALGPTIPPLLPGESVEFDLEGQTGAKYLSIVSMLICTNDGFTGVSGIRLPSAVGETTELYAGAYDAGTEINTEDFDDLVPPCGPLTDVDSDGAGTGESNPELAEGGVITMHEGIAGDADLLPDVHGWDDPVAHVEVERIG